MSLMDIHTSPASTSTMADFLHHWRPPFPHKLFQLFLVGVNWPRDQSAMWEKAMCADEPLLAAPSMATLAQQDTCAAFRFEGDWLKMSPIVGPPICHGLRPRSKSRRAMAHHELLKKSSETFGERSTGKVHRTCARVATHLRNTLAGNLTKMIKPAAVCPSFAPHLPLMARPKKSSETHRAAWVSRRDTKRSQANGSLHPRTEFTARRGAVAAFTTTRPAGERTLRSSGCGRRTSQESVLRKKRHPLEKQGVPQSTCQVLVDKRSVTSGGVPGNGPQAVHE